MYPRHPVKITQNCSNCNREHVSEIADRHDMGGAPLGWLSVQVARRTPPDTDGPSKYLSLIPPHVRVIVEESLEEFNLTPEQVEKMFKGIEVSFASQYPQASGMERHQHASLLICGDCAGEKVSLWEQIDEGLAKAEDGPFGSPVALAPY